MKITLGHVIASLGAALWLIVIKAVSTQARIVGVAAMQKVTDCVSRWIVILGFALLGACVWIAHMLRSDGAVGKK